MLIRIADRNRRWFSLRALRVGSFVALLVLLSFENMIPACDSLPQKKIAVLVEAPAEGETLVARSRTLMNDNIAYA